MSERKRTKRRKDVYTGPGGIQNEIHKPSKDEYIVAKWLKNNIKTKRTKCLNHNVEYFTSSKALDALMESKFAQEDNCLFPTREHATDFLDLMLEHKFFHRAKKVAFFPEDLKVKSKKSDQETVKSEKKDATDPDSSYVEGNNESILQKEKRKRKIRLDMHTDQIFVDGSEAYVWIYDPVPIHYWVFGTLIVLGAIIVCMFPLWPPILRKGVYYLSLVAAGLLVFILALSVIRLLIFVILWVITASKMHFWLFPNLAEDVGFFASFWPLYEYEYRKESKPKSLRKSKKKKKDKLSDVEDEKRKTEATERIEVIKRDKTVSKQTDDILLYEGEILSKQHNQKQENKNNRQSELDKFEKELLNQSESESEASRSSAGKDFEIVDKTDVENS